jgi:hypothetical protein
MHEATFLKSQLQISQFLLELAESVQTPCARFSNVEPTTKILPPLDTRIPTADEFAPLSKRQSWKKTASCD